MRQRFIAVLLVVTVLLSGCSGVIDQSGQTPTATAGSFSETVQFPHGGVVGEESIVEVEVTNDGDSEATYNATLRADEEGVVTESVTLGAGNSTTLSLAHTFEETGNHTLSVAGESTTITVYETPGEFTDAAQAEVETARIEESSTLDGQFSYRGEVRDYYMESNSTIEKNFTAETLFEEGTTETTVSEESGTSTSEEWLVDGRRYIKETDEDGETTYEWEPDDEFEDGGDNDSPSDIDIEQYRRTNHTDEEYVFIISADNPSDAAALWGAFGGSSGLAPESITSVYFEYRYDRQTGRSTGDRYEVQIEDSSVFPELEITITKTYVSYGDPVTVEVPDDVRDNATWAGSTSGTNAALAPAY